jgi:hypothetical protein
MILAEYIAPAWPFYLLIGAALLFIVPLLLWQWWRDFMALRRAENDAALPERGTLEERRARLRELWEEDER